MSVKGIPGQCPHCSAPVKGRHEEWCDHGGLVIPSECPDVDTEYQQGIAEGERRATARIIAYLQRDVGGHAAQLARSNAAYDIKQGEHLKEER